MCSGGFRRDAADGHRLGRNRTRDRATPRRFGYAPCGTTQRRTERCDPATSIREGRAVRLPQRNRNPSSSAQPAQLERGPYRHRALLHGSTSTPVHDADTSDDARETRRAEARLVCDNLPGRVAFRPGHTVKMPQSVAHPTRGSKSSGNSCAPRSRWCSCPSSARSAGPGSSSTSGRPGWRRSSMRTSAT